jgi:hypothetical protein
MALMVRPVNPKVALLVVGLPPPDPVGAGLLIYFWLVPYFFLFSFFLLCVLVLNGLIVLLFCANPNGFVYGGNEDLAVADFAGPGGLDDRVNGLGRNLVRYHQIQFDFGKEIHGVFVATEDFRVALLPPESADLAYGHPFDADLAQGVLYFLELERFDDRFDFLHVIDG